MKIYTKKGDQGQTSLGDGSKVRKCDPRLKAYGTVDELNAQLGLLICFLSREKHFSEETKFLEQIQTWLFQLGGQLACPDPVRSKRLPAITGEQMIAMEQFMDRWDASLSELKNFILPGGHPASSQAHICRCVARRAERFCVALDEKTKLDYPAIAFLNRLGDCLFVLARSINDRLGVKDIPWIPR